MYILSFLQPPSDHISRFLRISHESLQLSTACWLIHWSRPATALLGILRKVDPAVQVVIAEATGDFART